MLIHLEKFEGWQCGGGEKVSGNRSGVGKSVKGCDDSTAQGRFMRGVIKCVKSGKVGCQSGEVNEEVSTTRGGWEEKNNKILGRAWHCPTQPRKTRADKPQPDVMKGPTWSERCTQSDPASQKKEGK